MIAITSRINFRSGNGVTDTFPYDFRIDDDDYVKVYVDGVLQTISADYDVTNVSNTTGGNIVFKPGSIPGAGTNNVVIIGATPLTQLVQMTEGAVGFLNLELQGLDKLLMLVQELKLIFNTPQANRFLKWNDIAEQAEPALPDATEVTFTPTTGGDWNTAPTTAQEALDELADRIKTGGL